MMKCVGALLVAVFLSVSAVAQDSPSAAPTEVVESPTDAAREMSEEVGSLLSGVTASMGKIATAKNDDRELLIDRLIRDRDTVIETLPRLVAELHRLESEGVEVAALEADTRRFVDKILSIIERRFAPRKSSISRLRAERTGASPEELLVIEGELVRQNRFWDEALTNYLKVSELKEKLGADASRNYRIVAAELGERAELRAGQLRVLARRIDNAIEDSSTLAGDAATVAGEKVAQLKRESKRAAASLTTILDLMEKRKLDTVEYRQLLVETTGEISRGALNVGVLTGLARDLLKRAATWLSDNGPATVVRVLLFLGIVLVFRILAGLMRRLVTHGLDRSQEKFTTLLREFVISMSYRAILLFGVLIALSQLGIEVAPLLAGLGVAGFIVGFALQDTLSNFASGMMILAYRPFDVGDIIEAAGVSGIVDQLTLVSTTVRTFDNQRLIVPNTKIWGDVIINVTAEKRRRVDLVFGIGYGDDIDQAERVLTEIVGAHELILDDPAPTIKLHTLNDSSVDFVVRPWTLTKDYWSVYWDITREVKRRFDAEGISIPFPQRDVHLIKED